MVQRTVYSRISVRIAEEKQLLTEEKWIIDALTKIRKQRNCLQIELLELENIRTQLLMNSRAQTTPSPAPMSSETVMKLMSNASSSTEPIPQLEEALVDELTKEAFCNEQELNLTVTNPILSLNYDNMMEEVETDSEEDDENNSLLIDMNMFMNGDTRKRKAN